MLVDRVPSSPATKELRDFIVGGGRDLEFRIGPRVRHEAVLEQPGRRGTVRVEVLGSTLTASRLSVGSASVVTSSPMAHPVTFTGAIDWEAGIARGTFDSAMQRAANRFLLAKAVGLAAVLGVVLGLINPYVGVAAFVIFAALVWRLGGMSDRRFALIASVDLWKMAVLIGSPDSARAPS